MEPFTAVCLGIIAFIPAGFGISILAKDYIKENANRQPAAKVKRVTAGSTSSKSRKKMKPLYELQNDKPDKSWYNNRLFLYETLSHLKLNRISENIDDVELLNLLRSSNIWMDNKYKYCGSFTYIMNDTSVFRNDVELVVSKMRMEEVFLTDISARNKISEMLTNNVDVPHFSPKESPSTTITRYKCYRKLLKILLSLIT